MYPRLAPPNAMASNNGANAQAVRLKYGATYNIKATNPPTPAYYGYRDQKIKTWYLFGKPDAA